MLSHQLQNGSHYTTHSNITNADVAELDLDGQKSVTLAVYKNNVLAVRRLGKTGLSTNRCMQMELKNVSNVLYLLNIPNALGLV